MKKVCLLLSIALLTAVSCESNNLDSTAPSADDSICTLTLNDVTTKAQLDNVTASWNEGDIIHYIQGVEGSEPLEGKKEQAKVASDSKIALTNMDNNSDYFILIHTPSSASSAMANYSVASCAFLANTGDHGTGTFNEAFVCGAKISASATEVTMKPLTALLEINNILPRSDIKKVVMTGGNSERICGRIQVDFSSEDYTSKYYDKAAANGATPFITFESDAKKGTHPYYFSVAPQTLSNGYSLTFYGNDGSADYVAGTVTMKSPSTFTQGYIKPILSSSIVAEYPIAGVAKRETWTNGSTGYTTCEVDNNVKMEISSNGTQGAYYTSDGGVWRLYYARGKELTITCAKKNTKVKIFYSYDATKGEGAFFDGDTQINSGDEILVENGSKTLTLARINGSDKNFQLNVSSVKVAYSL